jgi:hypothetical protein
MQHWKDRCWVKGGTLFATRKKEKMCGKMGSAHLSLELSLSGFLSFFLFFFFELARKALHHLSHNSSPFLL